MVEKDLGKQGWGGSDMEILISERKREDGDSSILICDGGIEEIINRIDFIRAAIPGKNEITAGEIKERLEGKRHGIKLAHKGKEFLGLTVWHEKNPEEAYLWLGAYKVAGQGIGTMVLEQVIKDIEACGFRKISTKIGKGNLVARKHLEKYNFREANVEGEVCIMEKETRQGSGQIPVEINPHVIAVRESDWPIKVFYSLIRHLHEEGNSQIIDIGSTVEVDEENLKQIKFVIEVSHWESLADGHYTEYPSSWGFARFRKCVAAFFKEKAGVEIDPIKEVMVTGGIIRAVDTAIQALDITHVIIPSLAPYFAGSLAILRGKQIIEVPLDLKTGNFDLGILKNQLTENKVERGKALFYMTLPSAPAGTLPEEEFIENELIPFARNHTIPIISDTYVLATTFSGERIRPLMSYPGAKEVAVEAITVSKELGLPGARAGGVVGHPQIINAMRLFAASSLEILSTANQNLAANALITLRPEPVAQKLKHELTEEILPRFKAMDWPVIIPQAGLDMLVEVPRAYQEAEVRDHSLLASLSLATKYGIAFCPASVFGSDGDRYLRIVLKQADRKIPRALDQLREMGFTWSKERPDPVLVNQVQELIKTLDLTNL